MSDKEGFGFNDKTTAKEDEYKDSARVKWTAWKSLKVGQKVKSTLTDSDGVITKMEDVLHTISIEWENGNKSRASRYDLENVVIIDNSSQQPNGKGA